MRRKKITRFCESIMNAVVPIPLPSFCYSKAKYGITLNNAKWGHLTSIKVTVLHEWITLGAFLCIRTAKKGQLNPLFHTFAGFRPIVNRFVARQSTDWSAANAQILLMINYFSHTLREIQ